MRRARVRARVRGVCAHARVSPCMDGLCARGYIVWEKQNMHARTHARTGSGRQQLTPVAVAVVQVPGVSWRGVVCCGAALRSVVRCGVVRDREFDERGGRGLS